MILQNTPPLYQGFTLEEEGLVDSHHISADDLTYDSLRALQSTQTFSIYELGLCGYTEDGTEAVFFVGIIDCLTAYTFMKQTATLFKRYLDLASDLTLSILWDSETLSTVAATFYAERFLNFMTKVLLADEKDYEVLADYDVC